MNGGYLLVRAGARLVGLPIAHVVEVIEPGPTYPVPAVEPAVRGVATIRGRILPVVHLGAFLDGGCPPAAAGTGVVLAFDGHRLCLEVEEAESVLHEPGAPIPSGAAFPWATGVARCAGDLVPLVDPRALAGALLAGALAARPSEVQPA